jgi:hypothetical protein
MGGAGGTGRRWPGEWTSDGQVLQWLRRSLQATLLLPRSSWSGAHVSVPLSTMHSHVLCARERPVPERIADVVTLSGLRGTLGERTREDAATELSFGSFIPRSDHAFVGDLREESSRR